MRAVTDTCSNRYHLITSGSHSWAHTAILFMLGSGGFYMKNGQISARQNKNRQVKNAKLWARSSFPKFRDVWKNSLFSLVLFVLQFRSWLRSSCQTLIWFVFFRFANAFMSTCFFLRKQFDVIRLYTIPYIGKLILTISTIRAVARLYQICHLP